MTAIDTTPIRSELELHPDGEPISAIWSSNTVTALCDEVDQLRAENERLREALCRLTNELDLGERGVLHGVPAAIASARAALQQQRDAEGLCDDQN